MISLKRLTACLLCFLMVLGLCACKEAEKSPSKNKQSQSSDENDDGGSSHDPDHNGNGGNSGNSTDGITDIYTREDGVTLPPLTAPEETAEEVAEEFITAMQNSDWDTVNQRLNAYSFSAAGIGHVMAGGIMEKIMSTATVESQTVTDNGDGTYTVSVTLEAIDFRALIQSLPETVNSKEAARAEMLRLADSAARKTFAGEYTILRYSAISRYYIEPDISFINAITGGLYDVYEEYFQEVTAE